MQSVVIVGAGGFGREVLEIFKDQNRVSRQWNILGFIDENTEIHGKAINGYPVLGGLDWIQAHKEIDLSCVVTIGDSRTRKEMVEKLAETSVQFCNAIHPSVIMSDSVSLGKGVIICAGSILTVNIVIGDHVHINTNTTIGHDAIIKDYCTVTATVKITGNTVLNEGVFMGTAAIMIPGVTIGSWTTIGAGAVVINDIPEKVVAVGMPAKAIKNISD